MKNAKLYAVAALAGIGAAQVIRWLNLGVIHALVMSNGEWTVEEATKAAPWILAALIAGVALSLIGTMEESRQYMRSAERQCKSLTVAHGQHNDARRDA